MDSRQLSFSLEYDAMAFTPKQLDWHLNHHTFCTISEWMTEERGRHVTRLDEIRKNESNLNIALYLDTTEPEELVEVAKELRGLQRSTK